VVSWVLDTVHCDTVTLTVADKSKKRDIQSTFSRSSGKVQGGSSRFGAEAAASSTGRERGFRVPRSA
jgi:hypothetical protein